MRRTVVSLLRQAEAAGAAAAPPRAVVHAARAQKRTQTTREISGGRRILFSPSFSSSVSPTAAGGRHCGNYYSKSARPFATAPSSGEDVENGNGQEDGVEDETPEGYRPPRRTRAQTTGPQVIRKEMLAGHRRLVGEYQKVIKIQEHLEEEQWQVKRRDYLLEERKRNAENFRLKKIQQGIMAADYQRKRAVWDRRTRLKAAKRVGKEAEQAAVRKEMLQALKRTCDKWEASPDETRYRRYVFNPEYKLEGKFAQWVQNNQKYGRT